MSLRMLSILFACLLSHPVLGLTGSITEDPGVASGIKLLQSWVGSQMAYRGLPGMSIGIVYDQELIWARGFGFANIESKIPVTPDTIFRIASNSKVFTSIAIMKLRDEGRLQLDDPVAKYLPWFRIKNTFPDAKPITIRHLLTHTSGLPREAVFSYWNDYRFPSWEQIKETLPTQQTVYPAETKWKYSNLAVSLAGAVVATVSGRPYEEYVEKNIFEPLGMNSSSCLLSQSHRQRLASGYGRRMPDGSRGLMRFTEANAITPAGGLSSSVRDVARFLSWQLRLLEKGGREILKARTLREMHRVHWLHDDWKWGNGLGFQVHHREGGDLVGHDGWVAGYQTSIYLSPKQKVGVVVMANADDSGPYPGEPTSPLDKAFEWVVPAIRQATTPPAPKADPAWDRYVGVYRNSWRDTEIIVRNGQLVLISPTALNPLLLPLTLNPAGEHTFRLDGDGYGPLGETLVFELDSKGNVTRARIGMELYEKVR